MRFRRGALGIVALVISFAASSLARAQPVPRSEELRVRVLAISSAQCGDGRDFIAELSRRTSRLREATEDDEAIVFIIETSRRAGQITGYLTVRWPSGEVASRAVPGANCEEVEAAMALIAALMVDPLLAGGSKDEKVMLDATPAFREPVVVSRATSFSWRFEHRLVLRSAVAPAAAWGQALGATLTREAGAGLGWSRPSAGLAFQSVEATITLPAGSAEFLLSALQLTLCPVSFSGKIWGDWRACAAFQLGRLRGMGFDLASPASKSIAWSSAGIEIQGRYPVLGPLWLGVECSLTMPFTRERFYLDPDETLHRVPAWAFGGGLGLGLLFP